MSYATFQQYVEGGGTLLTAETFGSYAMRASVHIDTLTFNRIGHRGVANLSGYAQQMIAEAVCRQADFEYENKDAIESIVGSYSIGGVAVSFANAPGSVNVMGMLVSRDALAALESTGLMCLAMRW